MACVGPTSVSVTTGCDGLVVSRGSLEVTVLLFWDVLPDGSNAWTQNEYVPPCRRPLVKTAEVDVWGTSMLWPLLQTMRYVSWPELSTEAFHAKETLQAVLPVTSRLVGLVGGFLSGAVARAVVAANAGAMIPPRPRKAAVQTSATSEGRAFMGVASAWDSCRNRGGMDLSSMNTPPATSEHHASSRAAWEASQVLALQHLRR